MPTAAKGHRCTVLPMKQHEYLGQDVMAFPPRGCRMAVSGGGVRARERGVGRARGLFALEGALHPMPAALGVLLSRRAQSWRAARDMARRQAS